MNYIIKIGYQDYFLEGDNGLATFLKVMGRMNQIDVTERDENYDIAAATLKPVKVEFKVSTLAISKKKAQEKQYQEIEPEVIHPPRRRSPSKQIGAGAKRLPAGAKRIPAAAQLRLLGEG